MSSVAEPLRLPPNLERLFPAALRSRLVALRHDLHRVPELSSREEKTASRLHEELAALHPAALARLAGTGVVARIRGRDPHAPLVAVRGDIDALPIQEETGLPFASEVPRVMHACGHDVHATWAVGAAHLLTENPAGGDTLIVLQPAEETAKGALALLETGVLNEVRAIFGAHVDRRFPVGRVVAEAGPLAAAADLFEIELIGRGAHAARPHESADPIVGAGALISNLQTLVSRRLNPATPGVVSVATIHAGTAANVIPERVRLTGTLRAMDPDTRRLLHEELRHVAESTAATYRLEARVSIELGPPPIVNLPEPAAWARQAVVSVLGEAAVVALGTPNLAGEDFAFYLEKIPGCFLRIGAREAGGEATPAHTPRFHAAEESIFVGAAVLAEAARVASRALQS